ncbi:class I SAM-dependent methyltransferase [Acinetobacter sp. B5B]|uniref:class I SAM-dependent methyltransferase n=1 Tax=Acinetobacter baretiae TaxID=2605383 RepID=UPI0018C1DE1B|nr:class I SAM-dependent methyltransferase [Acinetobacter baretiae]MBF7683194.1 class I SAM-dependent methyltransferase [Acinetobacter baretiae]MBF7684441.1 class I SAM-dependent methyltransferase [Acinetobacter baretiae]
MDPRSEVILRQKAYLKGKILFINAPSDPLLSHLDDHIDASIWTWNFTDHQQYHPEYNTHFGTTIPTQHYDQVVIFVPKSKELLSYVFHQVASHLPQGSQIFLVGEKKIGIERAAKQLKYYGQTLKLDSARHCQLWLTQLDTIVEKKPLQDWVKTYQIPTAKTTLHICALPGVFSQNRLDIGTAVLLPQLNHIRTGRIADFGCGAGVIACYLAKQNAKNKIYALDVDAFALESTKMTFEANQLTSQLECCAVQGIADAPDRLDAIVSNPPFHQGVNTHYAVSETLCRDAKLHLKTTGELWLVANRFLNYPPIIEQSFGKCTVKTDENGFKVLYAHA